MMLESDCYDMKTDPNNEFYADHMQIKNDKPYLEETETCQWKLCDCECADKTSLVNVTLLLTLSETLVTTLFSIYSPCMSVRVKSQITFVFGIIVPGMGNHSKLNICWSFICVDIREKSHTNAK